MTHRNPHPLPPTEPLPSLLSSPPSPLCLSCSPLHRRSSAPASPPSLRARPCRSTQCRCVASGAGAGAGARRAGRRAGRRSVPARARGPCERRRRVLRLVRAARRSPLPARAGTDDGMHGNERDRDGHAFALARRKHERGSVTPRHRSDAGVTPHATHADCARREAGRQWRSAPSLARPFPAPPRRARTTKAATENKGGGGGEGGERKENGKVCSDERSRQEQRLRWGQGERRGMCTRRAL